MVYGLTIVQTFSHDVKIFGDQPDDSEGKEFHIKAASAAVYSSVHFLSSFESC